MARPTNSQQSDDFNAGDAVPAGRLRAAGAKQPRSDVTLFLISAGIRYRRQRDLVNLIPDLPSDRYLSPSQLWDASRTRALAAARANANDLVRMSQRLRQLSWNRYPLYSLDHHAVVELAVAAERIIALWCELEIAHAAGVLESPEPLSPETDVDVDAVVQRLLPKDIRQ